MLHLHDKAFNSSLILDSRKSKDFTKTADEHV